MKLALREAGDPRGLPVALLHAFPMSSAMWEPQLAALKDFRVLLPDFRGFGATPLSAPWFIEHAVDDLFETLTAAGVEKAALAGLSMGGYVALRAVEKRPARVRALVLCDTRAEADANETKLKRAAAVDFVRARGTAAYLEPFLNDALAPKTKAEKPEVVEFLRGVAGRASPEAVMAALAALASRGDATAALPGVKVPAAVLVGSQDKLTPVAVAEAMRARIPGAELHLIADAGHFSNAENPEAFNERLRSFLGRL
ncbi:MAG TPA: alpha/beta fold hydrolase [Elusimicrobiota bacterium]|jgi:pimeloyl-ACP methyl ester carboxylesterase|nr:alpha/beta fold hydrolase [Elusimicrobiota bacterium]